MAAAGAEQPGSADARYLTLAGALGREAEDQEDLWLLVLDEWGLTVDAWEALPWWQQTAYLRALGRRNERRRTDAAAQQKAAAQAGGKGTGRRGRVAGRAASAQAKGPGGGGKRLRDTPLWAARGERPTAATTRPAPAAPPPSRR